MNPIRVLLVDDHVLFRKGVASLLHARERFEVVAEAGDGTEAMRLIGLLKPDVVLLDIGLPGCSGVEVLRQIKQQWPAMNVVMLTISDDDQDLFDAIRAGADGYLLKNLEPQDLFDMMGSVHQGEAVVSGALAGKIMQALRGERPSGCDEMDEIPITQRECDVLRLVAEGMTNQEIATALSISENTVKAHLRSVMEKLHLQNRVQAAVYAVRTGLVAD